MVLPRNPWFIILNDLFDFTFFQFRFDCLHRTYKYFFPKGDLDTEVSILWFVLLNIYIKLYLFVYVPGVSEKSMVELIINILIMVKYILYLDMCEVSTPYVKCNWSYECTMDNESKRTWMIKQKIETQTCLITCKSCLTHCPSCLHGLVTFDILGWNTDLKCELHW